MSQRIRRHSRIKAGSAASRGAWRKSLFWCAALGGLLVLVHLVRAQVLGGSAAPVAPQAATPQPAFVPFGFLWSSDFTPAERMALFAVLAVAIAGFFYALYLVRFIIKSDQGTAKMQEVAQAIREGSSAYLSRQRRTLFPIIVLIMILLLATANWQTVVGMSLPLGRSIAFLIGALFSMTVGTVGMLMATRGNLCVASAARTSFGRALQIGYRTGTVTGMLTNTLGLLGATLIFMYFGDRAPEVLLGFAFGGTLLALFMRVGGGIYTKAADVGADLVGKIEKGIPEDDPRNAATIADNVGDNVGDCAGMAADLFESYAVTMVAAMILGWACFGHKGVMFPLLVYAIGACSDMVSTFSVHAGETGGVKESMGAIIRGFRFAAVLNTIGFMVLGYFFLRFNAAYLAGKPLLLGSEAHLPYWANLGVAGLDMRPAEAGFCGIVLALVLAWCTEHFTGTEHLPVKSIVRASSTGHATNIIQGLAVGLESSVWAVLIIAGCILASVLIFSGAGPVFIAFGVSMCGVGMLSLTGNTLSMDVFGPVADNANGIGEMGYDREAMGEAAHKKARQILADLDATGNTTKAITKGIAIGSAVIAAVSLFASFITLVGSHGVSDQSPLGQKIYDTVSGMLNVADPHLFIGLLIGGAVPFLFGSMAIRAVGRAAYLIVKECRIQFRDPDICTGKRKPDYGRVVRICTLEAQRELIGPGLLAVLAPVLVGFLLGVQALAGFLAGAILSGQLLAVFMANSGGAWDNAKKVVEDEIPDLAANRGKGSERHKASVTGDTVGDPLKDTAGPAINPLLKVMNMVALLIIPLVLPFDPGFNALLRDRVPGYQGVVLSTNGWIAWLIAAVCALAIGWAVLRSKHEPVEDVFENPPQPFTDNNGAGDLSSHFASNGVISESPEAAEDSASR
jgi:K(+)-stimulated pyrophosphate-energized sodium pump